MREFRRTKRRRIKKVSLIGGGVRSGREVRGGKASERIV